MITNIKLDLSDDERKHLAALIDRKATKRMATRKDIIDMVDIFIDAVLNLNVADAPTSPGTAALVDALIPDINEGGWSFIDQ